MPSPKSAILFYETLELEMDLGYLLYKNVCDILKKVLNKICCKYLFTIWQSNSSRKGIIMYLEKIKNYDLFLTIVCVLKVLHS